MRGLGVIPDAARERFSQARQTAHHFIVKEGRRQLASGGVKNHHHVGARLELLRDGRT
jgi:hypothetical protein